MSREDLESELEIQKLELKIQQIENTRTDLRKKRDQEALENLQWMVDKCKEMEISDERKGIRLCLAVLRSSGITYKVAESFDSELQESPKKLGVGPLKIDWHIDSGSHKLFVDIWKDEE